MSIPLRISAMVNSRSGVMAVDQVSENISPEPQQQPKGARRQCSEFGSNDYRIGDGQSNVSHIQVVREKSNEDGRERGYKYSGSGFRIMTKSPAITSHIMPTGSLRPSVTPTWPMEH